ncbi:rhamnogalacturonan acetylesterase [Mucilaginibacter boryungensis]|uniref:Rhamnogalacturonan acetylesterase n=1 Tax=Mucilaginibacter boryungensis TaxID=768480 RepID=A0ABR9XG69_9SPHI|nr:rhamnogalacturonan acetylesterase [Mucilaginibacter boryungensis]MBE9666396.1 rhamnogalacturonan acetylesterase [Mucilaginibacter boryungensis]
MKRLKIAVALVTIAVAGLAFINQQKPTLYMVGDSTMHNNDKELWGWGTTIVDHLDLSKINVVNSATAGRSTRTFVKEGRWAKVDSALKPGDFVIMGFGHNEGSKPDTTKGGYRGVLKGIGEDSVVLNWAKGPETVHTYGWYLRKFIRDTKAKGATPIVVSMIPRREWDKDGKIVLANKDYGLWAKQVAEQEGVAFIDLNTITAEKYNKLTRDEVFALFGTDHTHTNKAGAVINAQSFVDGLKLQPSITLNNYLK